MILAQEASFSGERSPWTAGEYALSNSGLIHFPAGQARGRITLTLASDALREKAKITYAAGFEPMLAAPAVPATLVPSPTK